MTLRLNGSTSGYTEIDAPAVAGNNTLVLPGGNGSAGQVLQTNGSGTLSWVDRMTAAGPVFETSLASNQSVTSGTLTKVQLNTKGFDTANCFDAVANYRFTPNVSGYYQFNALVQGVAGSGSVTALVAVIRKNGSTDRNSTSATGGAFISSAVSCIYYMNGSTDYVEFYCQVNATSPYLAAGGYTFLSGCLLRP